MASNEHNIKVFISYRNVDHSQQVAQALAASLSQTHGYRVFIDREELKGGDIWRRKIFDNIRESDVLIVLLEADTAQSDWVQREVDIARGAHVSILPLRIGEDSLDVGDVQEKLALDDTQFLAFSDEAADYGTLRESLERLSKQTRDNQRAWIRNLSLQRRVRPALNNPDYACYASDGHPCQIHLATGDMTRLPGIDVLVNAENDYMQMARIFETATLSSALRREGALVRQGRLMEDTIQQELNDHITHANDFGLPVMMTQVIATHAGHPESNLVRLNRARYIFHAASVRVDNITSRDNLQPIQTDDGIRRLVHNCLEMVLTVDRQQGVISPPGTPRRVAEEAAQEAYQPLQSIIFPLFGTGQGGRSVLEVATPMIDGFHDFLAQHRDDPAFQLAHIHLCVFSELDIAFVENALDRRFEQFKT